jgi:segregation and condensation protein B
VNVDATLRTLLQRGYVVEVGHEHSPGSPALFGTTPEFLERIGLDSLAELPPLGDFVPEASVVEALERGLRVGDDAPGASDDPGDPDRAPGPAAAGLGVAGGGSGVEPGTAGR